MYSHSSGRLRWPSGSYSCSVSRCRRGSPTNKFGTLEAGNARKVRGKIAAWRNQVRDVALHVLGCILHPRLHRKELPVLSGPVHWHPVGG